jgi:hypothetical protein
MVESAEIGPSVSPVTADDLDRAVQLAVDVLKEAPPASWDRRGRLTGVDVLGDRRAPQ